MEFSIKTCLLDIQQSINEIFEFLGEKRDFKAYQQDLKTKKAVERNMNPEYALDFLLLVKIPLKLCVNSVSLILHTR
jgi:hypothetical protein